MRIIDVQAFPVSVPIPPEKQNKLGIGRLSKRDAVFVKVITDDGLVGWGEAHHGRNPGAVATIVHSTMRIAAMASAYNIAIHPHGGVTGLDLAAGIHVLAAVDNPGYFESSEGLNPLREGPFKTPPYAIDENGCVQPLSGPGLGLEVDEDFLEAHPVIDGPGFV